MNLETSWLSRWWAVLCVLAISPACHAGPQSGGQSSRVKALPADVFGIYGISPVAIEYRLPAFRSISPRLVLRVRQQDGQYASEILHEWFPWINSTDTEMTCRLAVALQEESEDGHFRLLFDGRSLDVDGLETFSIYGPKGFKGPPQIPPGDWVLVARSISTRDLPLGWVPRMRSDLQAYICVEFSPGPRLMHPDTREIGDAGHVSSNVRGVWKSRSGPDKITIIEHGWRATDKVHPVGSKEVISPIGRGPQESTIALPLTQTNNPTD